MTPVQIRLATIDDLTGLVTLENSCFDTDKISKKQYKAFLNKSSAKIFVAVDQAAIIGCLVVLFRKNSLQARIYSLAVHPKYRQAGIAKKLCKEVEAHIHRDYAHIVLEVRLDNQAAIHFYQKNGYEIFGSYTKFYEDGTNALRMRKTL